MIDLNKHQSLIKTSKTNLKAAMLFMNSVDPGSAEEFGLEDTSQKLEGLWHDAAIRLKELQVQSIQARKEQLEKEEQEQRKRERTTKGAGNQRSTGTTQTAQTGNQGDPTSQGKPSVLAKLRERISHLESTMEDVISHGLHIGAPRPLKKRPPTVALTKFKGSKKDYARFKQAFIDAYEDVGLSDISLAINLHENLEGEPKTKLAHLVDCVSDDTYATMWTCLDTFYGNEKEKATDRFIKFESMPPIKTFNAASISMLITALEGNWSLIQQHSNDSFLEEDNIHLIKLLKKIPLQDKDRFLDNCHFSSRKATFPVFKDWLIERWHRLKDDKDQSKLDRNLVLWQDDVEEPTLSFLQGAPELDASFLDWQTVDMEANPDGNAYMTYAMPSNADCCFFLKKGDQVYKVKSAKFGTPLPQHGNKGQKALPFRPPTNSNSNNSNKSQKSSPAASCSHCKKQGHFVQACDVFKALSVKDKYNSVRDNKLCIRCLSVGHIAKDCKLKFFCDVNNCGKRHHRLLHPDKMRKVMYQVFYRQGLESDADSDDEEEPVKTDQPQN